MIGAFTLLVTYEEEVGARGGVIRPGQVVPLGVRGERGFIQVVSPVQVSTTEPETSEGLLRLDPLELPAEFRLLSSAPSKATYQYTSRPLEFAMGVEWFEPGDTIAQVVEFAEAESQVSRDGEVVTTATYFVKTRGRQVLMVDLPPGARLWAVEVDGETVSAREDGRSKMIPLPAGVDANVPVEVKLRIAQATDKVKSASLSLPVMDAPVLKTEWKISGDQGRVLVPKTRGLPLAVPVLTESGLEWIASRALVSTACVAIFLALGMWLRGVGMRGGWPGLAGIVMMGVALVLALVLVAVAATDVRPNLKVLEYTLPVLGENDRVDLVVANLTEFGARVSVAGVLALVAGAAFLLWSVWTDQNRMGYRLGGVVLLTFGLLMQRGGAVIFYLVVAAVIAVMMMMFVARWWGDWSRNWRKKREQRAAEREQRAKERAAALAKQGPEEPKKKSRRGRKGSGDEGPPLPGASSASMLVIGVLLGLGGWGDLHAEKQAPPPPLVPAGYEAVASMKQDWAIAEDRLTATCTMEVLGAPGDRFVVLKSPGIMTSFDGPGLHVSKRQVPGCGMAYVVTVRDPDGAAVDGTPVKQSLRATFQYEMPAGNPQQGIGLATGVASIQDVTVRYDKAGWEFDSPDAMRAEPLDGLKKDQSGARMLLAPNRAGRIVLRPKARDVAAEESRFFVEAANLFLPNPGVVDGRHQLQVRPSQGELKELTMKIPAGFTVSDVGGGPVGTWQFDADAGTLRVVIEPAQATAFTFMVETQGSLDPLPAETTLAPVSVTGAANEVGLLALAFGPEAQPEKEDATELSAVNLADFDQGLIPERRGGKPVLHSVFRYGKTGGSLALRVAPVAPEVRVTTQQVLSIGDERLVLGVNFVADITRAGVFQLSFPLPDGLEVESLSGPALNHWTELTENGQRFVIMHLNGKTLGEQQFALSMAGMSPKATPEGWMVPKLALREAKRQTGELVVKPTPGIRLRTLSRKSISEVDPRSVGGQGEGALAFRVLQGDWSLALGIEKLDPWVTGSILHELTLREGQTRTSLVARLRVENASVRGVRVRLPGLGEDEAKTVRASGTSVSDIVRVDGEADLWEIQFKRRMLGELQVRLDFERTGERPGGEERLQVVGFPELRQMSYYFAVRAGARMGLGLPELAKGWQSADWNAVPQKLREAGDRSIPALTLRAVAVEGPLTLTLRPHAVADALKLRVVGGRLTSVVSPVGGILTAVDLDVEVVQRGALKVLLPEGEKLYNVLRQRGERHGGAGERRIPVLHPARSRRPDRERPLRVLAAAPGPEAAAAREPEAERAAREHRLARGGARGLRAHRERRRPGPARGEMGRDVRHRFLQAGDRGGARLAEAAGVDHAGPGERLPPGRGTEEGAARAQQRGQQLRPGRGVQRGRPGAAARAADEAGNRGPQHAAAADVSRQPGRRPGLRGERPAGTGRGGQLHHQHGRGPVPPAGIRPVPGGQHQGGKPRAAADRDAAGGPPALDRAGPAGDQRDPARGGPHVHLLAQRAGEGERAAQAGDALEIPAGAELEPRGGRDARGARPAGLDRARPQAPEGRGVIAGSDGFSKGRPVSRTAFLYGVRRFIAALKGHFNAPWEGGSLK